MTMFDPSRCVEHSRIIRFLEDENRTLKGKVGALEERGDSIDNKLLPELGRAHKMMESLTDKLGEVSGVVEGLVQWKDDTTVQHTVNQQKYIEKLEGQIEARKARWRGAAMDVGKLLAVALLSWFAHGAWQFWTSVQQGRIQVESTHVRTP